MIFWVKSLVEMSPHLSVFLYPLDVYAVHMYVYDRYAYILINIDIGSGYTHTCVYMYIYIYIHTYAYTCKYNYMYIITYISTYTYVVHLVDNTRKSLMRIYSYIHIIYNISHLPTCTT